jgi:hypothetical protein
MWKHEDSQRKNTSLTAAQVSDCIAGLFNHGADVNQGYLRRTFNNLDNPKALKGGAALPSISEDDVGPSIRAPDPKKKPAARKQPTARKKPAQKKKPAPKPTPQAPQPPSPSPPVIVAELRRSARGLIPVLTRKLVM